MSHSREKQSRESTVKSGHVGHHIMISSHVSLCRDKQPRESWFVVSHVSNCHDKQSRESLSWQVVTWVMICLAANHVQKANVDLTILAVYKNYKICEFLPRGQTLDNNMKTVIKRNANEGHGMDWSGRRYAFVNTVMKIRFHKTWEISWLAEEVPASQ